MKRLIFYYLDGIMGQNAITKVIVDSLLEEVQNQ
jgi:hypothetical protein